MTLDTPRLILRQLRESDLDAYAAMLADPEVVRYLGNGQTMSRAEAWRNLAMMIGHWQLRGYGLWAVEERASGALIGRIGLWNPEGWPGLEVGWALRREWWGKGFATEGARAAVSYAFAEMRVPQLISLIHPDNAASVRVAERLGERYDGTTELFPGRVAQVYRLRRADWQPVDSSAGRGGLLS